MPSQPIIVAVFIIATCLRVAKYSAKVSVTTDTELSVPTIIAAPDLSHINLCLSEIAIADSSTVLLHVNDSGFGLVSRLFGVDKTIALKTLTAMATLFWHCVFVCYCN